MDRRKGSCDWPSVVPIGTGAGIDAAGLFQAQLVDQFAADLTEGGALHEQVTPPEHPDIALGRSEGNRLGQLCRAGVTAAQLVGWIDEKALAIGHQSF